MPYHEFRGKASRKDWCEYVIPGMEALEAQSEGETRTKAARFVQQLSTYCDTVPDKEPSKPQAPEPIEPTNGGVGAGSEKKNAETTPVEADPYHDDEEEEDDEPPDDRFDF